jgi:hypothetical protein
MMVSYLIIHSSRMILRQKLHLTGVMYVMEILIRHLNITSAMCISILQNLSIGMKCKQKCISMLIDLKMVFSYLNWSDKRFVQ